MDKYDPKRQISLLHREGKQRTDVYCTECRKTFFATLDYDINGNHIIECPYCMHEHCRVIENGVITGDRWSSRMQRKDAIKCSTWKSSVIQAETCIASTLLREKWLNHSGG